MEKLKIDNWIKKVSQILFEINIPLDYRIN